MNGAGPPAAGPWYRSCYANFLATLPLFCLKIEHTWNARVKEQSTVTNCTAKKSAKLALWRKLNSVATTKATSHENMWWKPWLEARMECGRQVASVSLSPATEKRGASRLWHYPHRNRAVFSYVATGGAVHSNRRPRGSGGKDQKTGGTEPGGGPRRPIWPCLQNSSPASKHNADFCQMYSGPRVLDGWSHLSAPRLVTRTHRRRLLSRYTPVQLRLRSRVKSPRNYKACDADKRFGGLIPVFLVCIGCSFHFVFR